MKKKTRNDAFDNYLPENKDGRALSDSLMS